MASDPNAEPYERGKPNPVDTMADLSLLATLAYTHHYVLACGETWQAFADFIADSTDESPEWLRDMPVAISRIADAMSEIIETAGANWLAVTGESAET